MGEWPSLDAWARAGAGDRGVCSLPGGSRKRRQGWSPGRTFKDILLWWLILMVNLTAFRIIVQHLGWRWVCFKKNFSQRGETSPWRWATLSMCWSPELNKEGRELPDCGCNVCQPPHVPSAVSSPQRTVSSDYEPKPTIYFQWLLYSC